MNKAIAWVIVFLLLLVSANALDLMEDPVSCENTVWYNPATWFPCLSDKAVQDNMVKLHGPAFQFETFLTELSIISIDASSIAQYWAKMNYLAGVIFVIILIYTGYLLIFSAIDARKRIKAKIQVWNIFLIILFTNLSLALALLVLEIANLLTRYFWTTMLNGQISVHSIMGIIYGVQPMLSLLYFLVFLIFGIPFLIKIVTRLVLLIAFLASLPLIVAFNYFLPTKNFGSKFVKLFFINAFFPLIWILVFLFGKIIVTLVSGSIIIAELAKILVFAGCLYLNGYLYKTLAFNLSFKDAVSRAVGVGVSIWKTAKTIALVAGA